MHGIRRVLVFCTLITVLPTMLLVIPLYLRHSFYANVAYAVTESDILEVNDGISTIFCSEHTLRMNGTFNAFQMSHRPEVTSYRKHIRLKKDMNLPDDTLEYWGFYLLKGATVALSVCSRFQGASILIVKGGRILQTCGMLEHNNNKARSNGMFLPEADQQVKITFESNVQEISNDTTKGPASTAFYPVNTHNVSIENVHKENDEQLIESVENNDSDSKSYSSKESNDASITNINEDKLEMLYRTAETYIQKHMQLEHQKKKNNTRKLRHAKRRLHRVQIEKEKKQKEKKKYEDELKRLLHRRTSYDQDHYEEQQDAKNNLKAELQPKGNRSTAKVEHLETYKRYMNRFKRDQEPMKPPSLLDQGIKHGGNAGRNISYSNEASSVSSFESGLLNCYEGAILVAKEFDPSDQCVNVSYLLMGKHMQTMHDVVEDGYYYYIFYSDNDFVSNDIHALFDIYKPTFQYENVTKSCINQTECTFSLGIMSPDRVIVEIPTKDGIDQIKDDVNLLVSVCHPRMGMYVIFPIAVLFLVLGCAFM